MWWMKKHEATDAGTRVRTVSIGRALWAFLWKLALAVLLFYGVLQVLVRTDFFRSRMEAELSHLAGMEMRVGRIRATESLNLRFRDVISVSEVAGIEARLARIRWRLFRPRGEPMLESVRVDGLALTIAPDENGAIQPVFLGSLSKKVFDWAGAPLPLELGAVAGGMETVGGPSGKALEEWIRGPLIFRGVSVRWQDAQGNLQAAVTGMDVTWMSVETPNGGRISHVDCRAAEVKVVNGPRIMGLHVELIDTGGKQFLVDLDAADWGSAQKPPSVEAEYRELLDSMD
jgi:hypothetical protein